MAETRIRCRAAMAAVGSRRTLQPLAPRAKCSGSGHFGRPLSDQLPDLHRLVSHRRPRAVSRHRRDDHLTAACDQTGHDRLGLFNYLVGAGEDQRRDSEAERPGGLEVGDEVECGRLLDRKISRLSSLRGAIDIASGAAKEVEDAGAVSDEEGPRRTRAAADRRHPRGGDVGRVRCEKRFIVDDERIRPGLRDRRDLLFVTDAAHLSLRAAAGDARLMATLYHVPTSRSLRVLWALIGATVEVKSLGVRPRLHEPEYLAINPAGTLPALIDGDRAIYESLAICEYLAARHGSDLVVAPDEPERPEFVQWLLYGEGTIQA